MLLVFRIGSDNFFAELHGSTRSDSHSAPTVFSKSPNVSKLATGFLHSLDTIIDSFLIFVQLMVHVVEGDLVLLS